MIRIIVTEELWQKLMTYLSWEDKGMGRRCVSWGKKRQESQIPNLQSSESVANAYKWKIKNTVEEEKLVSLFSSELHWERR